MKLLPLTILLGAFACFAQSTPCGATAVAEQILPGMRLPEVMFKLTPQYTEQAMRQNIRGTVKVCLVIDDEGQPSHLSVTSGLGAGLDELALDAVSKWHFIPAISDDSDPVTVWAEVKVEFSVPDPVLPSWSKLAVPPQPTPQPEAIPAEPTSPDSAPFHPTVGSTSKKRVFIGDSKMFVSSSFGITTSAPTVAGSFPKATGTPPGFSSEATYDFAINIMKSLQQNCPDVDVTNDDNIADYFVRVDLEPALLMAPAKIAVFDRSRTMVFVDRRATMTRTVKSFCKTLAP